MPVAAVGMGEAIADLPTLRIARANKCQPYASAAARLGAPTQPVSETSRSALSGSKSGIST